MFDDEEYGVGVLSYMKRGNTVDDRMADLEEKIQLVYHQEGLGH